MPTTGADFIRFEFFRQRGTIFRFWWCKINHFRIIQNHGGTIWRIFLRIITIRTWKLIKILYNTPKSVLMWILAARMSMSASMYLSFSYFNKATYKKSLSLFCIHGLGWRLLIKCPVAQSKSSIPKKNYWNNLQSSKPISSRIILIILCRSVRPGPSDLPVTLAVWAECKQRHVSCVSSGRQLQSQCRNILSHSQILSHRSSTFFGLS